MSSPWYTGRVGLMITGVGLVHTACTPVFFPEATRSIVGGGIVGTVSAEPRTAPVRTAGFWYAATGVATAAFGWMTSQVERRGDPLPRALPAVLAAAGAVGATLDPTSGFWVFLPLAGIARAAVRRARAAG
jgi:H+/gluconate symporter-like permease